MRYVWGTILASLYLCLLGYMVVVTWNALQRAAASDALTEAFRKSFEGYLRTHGHIDPAFVCKRRN